VSGGKEVLGSSVWLHTMLGFTAESHQSIESWWRQQVMVLQHLDSYDSNRIVFH
jgi:hypothetical protein